MRILRLSILVACLLLSGSVVGVPRGAEPARTLVTTVEGCRVWLDHLPAGATASWFGKCGFRARLAEGPGRLDVVDRSGAMIERYDGTMRDGLKHQDGREFKNSTIYIGRFVRGLRDGRGEQIIHGVRYDGAFHNGKRSGHGTMVWLNRDAYRGAWKDDLPDGYGELLIGAELIAGQWRAGCLLNSERRAAVATSLDSCRALAPSPATGLAGDAAPVEPRPPVEGGCRPVSPGSLLRLCNGLFMR